MALGIFGMALGMWSGQSGLGSRPVGARPRSRPSPVLAAGGRCMIRVIRAPSVAGVSVSSMESSLDLLIQELKFVVTCLTVSRSAD